MVKQQQKIYLFSAFLFVVTAYFSQGFYHCDEHAQVMEFAGMKLGLTEKANLAWEYGSEMRPAIQPFMVYVAHRFFGLFGIDSPFAIAFILRLFSAALSFLSIHLLLKAFLDKVEGEKLKLSFVLLSFLLWFSVYNSVRFSSENLAGRVFIIAFALFFIWKEGSRKQYFLVGALLGLSFLFRYQNMFLIAGFLAWMLFINKSKFTSLLILALGIVALFGVGVLIDRWFYDEWVLSIWKYFEENILNDKASGFGVAPWYYYFTKLFNQGIPPFSLLYIVPFILLLIYRPKNPVVWVVLPFLLVHMYIGHKELRFLFPLVGLLPLLAVQSGELINEKWKGLLQMKFFKVFTVLFWIQNGLFLCYISFSATESYIPMFEKIYTTYEQPAVLYYIEKNPYDRALDIHYYRRTNLRLQQIDNITDIHVSPDTLALFATFNDTDAVVMSEKNKLIYYNLSDDLKKYNVNNWVSRTLFWKVFEVKALPAKP
ncbi:MAG: glycosyltransferase family 39 protein [Bacteroidetes bacterium]|nr:glycosyltransferase family 39 protein [Bacteroidota bacterium]